MMFPKNRIRLSRSLRAQTNPYPNVARWTKRGLWVLLILLVVGIYYFARPDSQTNEGDAELSGENNKQILGEQEVQPENAYTIHEVGRGDTLFNLSLQYDVPWEALAEFNNLDEPYILRIGQELKIPQKTAE